MDNTYKNSITWKRTLGQEGLPFTEQQSVNALRQAYFSIRKKVAMLSANINSSLPNYNFDHVKSGDPMLRMVSDRDKTNDPLWMFLVSNKFGDEDPFCGKQEALQYNIEDTIYTVHDITHIDSLWDSTDLLLGTDYPLNPVEGFVLGLAFLLHDLGMGLVAYKNGFEDIKKTEYWKDIVASEYWKKYGFSIGEKDWDTLEKSDPDIASVALKNTLRNLHAEQASQIALQEWAFNEKKEYLIDDAFLREAFGEIAGRIAYSHWWGYDRLIAEFRDMFMGTPGDIPSKWQIDVLKLACILRTADAIQVDGRRAPLFLMILRRPVGLSLLHWLFQDKLNKPIVVDKKLRYSTKQSFSSNEMDAWWVCYDIMVAIDKELKSVDSLLMKTAHEQFTVRGVYGITTAKELSNDIKVDRWIPVDTAIRVSNVGALVSSMGGSQLYGDDMCVPFRELVQNGADAIRARRILEGEDQDYGEILITQYKVGNEHYISFEDNGIGMSENVLVGPFLDFGQSFWNTHLMYEELPGLASKGFYPTGKYGIGFYSIFMWSHEAVVITRRFDYARSDTLVLEFRKGAINRPILRKATIEEQRLIRSGGTKVTLKISEQLAMSIASGSVFSHLHSYNEIKDESVEDQLIRLCPCLDCNLRFSGINNKFVIKGNSWRTVAPIELIKRLLGSKAYDAIWNEENNHFSMRPSFNSSEKKLVARFINNMDIISDNHHEYGRAFIHPFDDDRTLNMAIIGRITVGGFKVDFGVNPTNIGGVLFGRSTRLSRDAGIPVFSQEALQKWGNSQLQKVKMMNLDEVLQLRMSEIFYNKFGIIPQGLVVTQMMGSFLRLEDIAIKVHESTWDKYYLCEYPNFGNGYSSAEADATFYIPRSPVDRQMEDNGYILRNLVNLVAHAVLIGLDINWEEIDNYVETDNEMHNNSSASRIRYIISRKK